MTRIAPAPPVTVPHEAQPLARPADALTLAHQKADFTAEGAPPPGRVGKAVPARGRAGPARAPRERPAR